MLKILALFFLTFPVFAATLVLDKHVTSGFVAPEYRFVKDCHITSDRSVSITIVNGNGTATGYTRKVSASKMYYIRLLLQAARRGKIVKLPVLCDAGTNIVKGFLNGTTVVLDENIDCVSHRLNKSRATADLKKLARQICGV